jgi:hypothetical protein
MITKKDGEASGSATTVLKDEHFRADFSALAKKTSDSLATQLLSWEDWGKFKATGLPPSNLLLHILLDSTPIARKKTASKNQNPVAPRLK